MDNYKLFDEADMKILEEIKQICKERDKKQPTRKIVTTREYEERIRKGLDCTNHVTLDEVMGKRFGKHWRSR